VSRLVTFTIPGRPRGKERPRAAPGQSRPYTPARTVAAEREILTLFKQARRDPRPLTGPVLLTIEAVFPIPAKWPKALRDFALTGRLYCTSKPDRDNIEKLVADALNGIAWCDDAQVVDGPVLKRYGQPARTVVRVEAVDQPDVPDTEADQRREAWVEAGQPPKPRRPRQPKQSKSGTKSLPSALQAAVNRALAKERP
jgi:Holliday junction resolvase RusA-like endonuclease